MYKLKNVNGKVNFLLRSGKDFVKNEMSISGAQHIIDHGKQRKQEVKGYPINIDGKWHFEGEEVKATPASEVSPIPEEIGEEEAE